MKCSNHLGNSIESFVFCFTRESKNWTLSSSSKCRLSLIEYIYNSNNIRFSVNLVWCSECIWCSWLENQSYCIQNIQYDKQDYLDKKEKLLKNRSHYAHILQKLPKTSANYSSDAVTGNHITLSSNVENWRCVNRLSNWRNVAFIWWENQETNFFDVFDGGVWSSDMVANEWTWSFSSNVYCSSQIEYSTQILYSYYLVNCSYCFWCVWLQNKQFCIFNKEYEKQERHEKVDEILHHMEGEWILGDFFPGWMNPFYVNDTAAVLLEDFEKEELDVDGYLRRDESLVSGTPEWVETVSHKDLWYYEWDNQFVLDQEILQKVLVDSAWNAYTIPRKEFEFLRRYNLPLPREHRLERVKSHFEM